MLFLCRNLLTKELAGYGNGEVTRCLSQLRNCLITSHADFSVGPLLLLVGRLTGFADD